MDIGQHLSTCLLFTLRPLSSFQELKVFSPWFSREAFAKLLERGTKCGGRVSEVFLWYCFSISRCKYLFLCYISVRTDWACQQRCSAAQLSWWGRAAVLWCQLQLPSMHTWNVGGFSWWEQKAISLSAKRKVLIVDVLCFCVFMHMFLLYLHNSAVCSTSFTSLDSSQAIENAWAELMSLICLRLMFSAILMVLSLTVFAERGISLIFWTISPLFLKSENRCSDIFMNNSFKYSLSVNGFPLFTISRAATQLAVLVGCGELIHFLKDSLLSSAFRSSSEIALFRSSSVGYFSANAKCLFWKCLSTLHLLLFDILSLHIKHTGKPASLAVNANKYVHAELNSLFSS